MRKIEISINSSHRYNSFFFSLIENGESQPASLVLEFRVFLVSAQTGKHTQESRTLRFWFREIAIQNGHSNHHHNHSNGDEHAAVAQDFFRELVSPQEFPRGEKLNSFFVNILTAN